MSQYKDNNSVEKLDVESLIVDLLACGLGACIILFFIFSIKIIGKSTQDVSITSPDKKPGIGPAYISLIGDNGDPKKRMGSVRIIEISKMTDENFNKLKNYAASGDHDFWNEFKNFKGTDKISEQLLASIRTQVQIRKNNISFILYADGMRDLSFSFPDELKKMLQNTRDVNATVKIYALEGKLRKGAFNGTFESHPYQISDLQKLDITFKIGKASRIEKLIKVEGAK